MSYIKDFQRKIEEENLQKSSKRVITIDGLSGAGKGTLSKQIGEIMDLPVYSAGDFFRSIADERGLTLHELEQQADKETDMEVDRRTLMKGMEESCVIESRIASRVLGDYSDLRIRLKASLEERARRIKGRENEKSLEKVKERVEDRDKENWRRYQEYYGLEDDLEIYHFMVDNTDMSLDQQRKVFRAFLDQWFT
jgi:predicted cytidylate kinase